MACICCQEKINKIDYKETGILRKFITGQFKIRSHKRNDLCKKHQRLITRAIKNARHMALLPYTRSQARKSRTITAN